MTPVPFVDESSETGKNSKVLLNALIGQVPLASQEPGCGKLNDRVPMTAHWEVRGDWGQFAERRSLHNLIRGTDHQLAANLVTGNLCSLLIPCSIPVPISLKKQFWPPKRRPAGSYLRNDRTPAWWNKHESDVVWKSMKNSIQRRDEESDSTPALDLDETEISSIVAAGGGRYVGVLKEIPGKMESVVLFISPQTRTTLGLSVLSLTVEAVRKRLTESDAAFARAGAK